MFAPCTLSSEACVESQVNRLSLLLGLLLKAQYQSHYDGPLSNSALTDTFGRQHNYLRISLTERCFYCMPNEGVELSPKATLLSNDEIIRLAHLFVRSGVTKIRLTGGEPTVRKDIVDLVGRLNDLRSIGLQSIGMTTNGLVLHRYLPALIENGLTHVNISLDTLDPFTFEIMTRRRGHEAVIRSLDAALDSGRLESVKLNVVVIRGLNDREVLDFVEMTRDRPVSVRFIEFMPFTGNKWDKSKMIPSTDLLERIRGRYPDIGKASDELNDTARSYQVPSFRGSIGFISSMSDHFCGTCNRLRLTADGQIKVCLFDAKEMSLRDQMRSGVDDDELLRTIGKAVHGKKEKHAGMEDIDVVANRPMILIGAPQRVRVQSTKWAFLAHPSVIRPESIRAFSTASSAAQSKLTHMDESGRPSMVDVSSKDSTSRSATARGRIFLPYEAFDLVSAAPNPSHETSSPDEPSSEELAKAKAKARAKGDVLVVAQLAAIMASKRTSDLIPLCHPLPITHVSVSLVPEIIDPSAIDAPATRSRYSVLCTATVRCSGKTGVEMEALTAVSVGLLTVWDMLKAVAGKEMIMGQIYVSHKSGGKSGDFERHETDTL
ncbi:molybdenum cofactor biosynthesis prote [Peniophora sp. CONT]|nr:molybdenum cofactor biosynthesis prote [Peniophora sp. CONT]